MEPVRESSRSWFRRKAAAAYLVAVLGWGTVLAVGADAAPEGQGPLTLQEAVEQAVSVDPAVRLAEVQAELAQLNLEVTRSTQLTAASPSRLLAAENEVASAGTALAAARSSTVLAVVEDYHAVLEAQDLEAIARQSLAVAEDALQETDKRHKGGAASDAELLQDRTRAAAARNALARSTSGLEMAIARLESLVGEPLQLPLAPPEGVAFTGSLADAEIDLLVVEALENRLEVAQARADVAVSQREPELARDEGTPALSLRQAELALEASRLKLSQQETRVALEVRTAWTSVTQARALLDAARAAELEARELVRVAELRARLNTVTPSDVAEMRLRENQARADRVHAEYSLELASARLLAAVGRPLADGGELR